MDKKSNLFKHLDFLMLDSLSVCLSFYVAFLLSFYKRYHFINPFNAEIYRTVLVVEILLLFLLVYIISPYKGILKMKNNVAIKQSIILGFALFVGTIFILYLIKGAEPVSRMLLIIQCIIFILFSVIFKLLRKNSLHNKSVLAIENGTKSIILVVNSDNIERTINNTYTSNYDNYRVIGLCSLDKNLKGKIYGKYKVVANAKDLLSYICTNWIDCVYFDMPYIDVPKDIRDGLYGSGIKSFYKISDLEENNNRFQNFENVMNSVVLTSSIVERSNVENLIKRVFDIIGGLVGCLITLVLTIIVGPIIFIKSPGHIFYKQERIGLNGKKFKMYKFRSMYPNADEHKKELESQNISKDGLTFKVKNDPRIIHGIGNFIRKTSIDEFPQFFNVLKGDMSLVGTRPPTVDEWNKYELKHRIRMSTKPGITGMWQASGRNNITDFDEIIKLDRYYIMNWSFGLDISLIFKTIIMIFKHKDGEAL